MNAPPAGVLVSFVLATRNRRDIVLSTLQQIQSCGLDPELYEVHVVDDASTDDTSPAIRERFPAVKLITQTVNRGPVSKNAALPQARGEYIVFLDDDSYPLPGSIERMVEHFEADAGLGAAVFAVSLPDGTEECSAYPNVFIGCGTGFRRRALEEAGGLPEDFFMQAEEYDLSLRLMRAGWRIGRFEDIRVLHLKAPTARVSARTMRLDVRNNLTLVARYFPRRWILPYAIDWMRRYYFIADAKGLRGAWWRGMAAGIWRSIRPWRRTALDDSTFEAFARIEETYARLRQAQEQHGLKTILFVDLGKNIHAYWLAARRCGLRVVAIADSKLTAPGRQYRGIPVLDDESARRLTYDAAIICNLSPVHATRRRQSWEKTDHRPTIDLFY